MTLFAVHFMRKGKPLCRPQLVLPEELNSIVEPDSPLRQAVDRHGRSSDVIGTDEIRVFRTVPPPVFSSL